MTSMSVTASKSYPGLGFDPAPGDSGQIQAMSDQLDTVARELSEAHNAIASIGRADAVWCGAAADAFRGKVGVLPDLLDHAKTSLGEASSALDNWAHDLTSLQTSGNHYEAVAEQALSRLAQARANPDLGLARQTFTNPADLDQAQRRLNNATAEVNAAVDELNGIRQQASRLRQQHDRLAQQVAAMLRKAAADAVPRPGLLDEICDAVKGFVDGVRDFAKSVWQWVVDHADTIAEIGDVLNAVGTALSLFAGAFAEIPVVGQVLAIASVGVNGLALAAHATAKAAGADVSDFAMAQDALNMLPGYGAVDSPLSAAVAAPKIFKAVKAEKTVSGALKAVDTAVHGIADSKALKSLDSAYRAVGEPLFESPTKLVGTLVAREATKGFATDTAASIFIDAVNGRKNR